MLISFPDSIWKAIFFFFILLFSFFFFPLDCLVFIQHECSALKILPKVFHILCTALLTALQKNKTHIYTFNLASQMSLKVSSL